MSKGREAVRRVRTEREGGQEEERAGEREESRGIR